MFFKNAVVYQLTHKDMFKSLEHIETALAKFSFKPCWGHDFKTMGWISPLPEQKREVLSDASDALEGKNLLDLKRDQKHDVLAHSLDGKILFAFKQEQKTLPTSVITKELDKRVSQIETEQNRIIKKKERTALKEDIITSLLPRCFTTETITYGYYSNKSETLVIDSSSISKTEQFISFLRKTLGSLPVVPPQATSQIDHTFTTWLQAQENPEGFKIGYNAKLFDNEEKSKIFLKNEDLFSDEILAHVNNKKIVSEIELHSPSLKFIVSDPLQFKSIKFNDEIHETNCDLDNEDLLARFEADFILMAGELDETIAQTFKILSIIDRIEQK